MFDPYSADLISDPYAFYAALREEAALHWNTTVQAWVVTRMEEVKQVLSDPSFIAVDAAGVVREMARRTGRDYRHLARFLDAVLFFRDGAAHARERRTLVRVMSAVRLSQLEPVVQRIADALIAAVPRDRFDAISHFADPLPQLVMAYILGIPEGDVPLLSALLAEVTLVFGPTSVATYDRLNDDVGRALDLIMSRIAENERSGADNGLSQIYAAAVGEGDERLANAAATAIFMLRVGSETTIGLIGLMIRQLVDDPELLEAARESSQAIDAIVSEVLRLESNVQRAGRIATAERTVGSTPIRSGDRMLLLIGAANRDPACFAEPDRLLLHPDRPLDLSFGAGKHVCLGASLARIEARAALNALLRLPRLDRDGPEYWYQSHMVRRLTALPLKVER